jgi:hypothetical protein
MNFGTFHTPGEERWSIVFRKIFWKISSAVIPTNLLSGNLSDNALSKSFPIKPCGNDMYIGRMKRHNNLEHTIFSTKMLLTFGESKNGTKIR